LAAIIPGNVRAIMGTLRELPLSVAIPIAIAAASYHFIEKPILGLKERLASQA
jgi:peptidoglycan/LPS O-acetylase OafA/YrhL